MDSTRSTERLVVADERRPAVASREVLRAPDASAEHDIAGLPRRGRPNVARVIWIETARAERDRLRTLARFGHGPQLGRL